MADLFVSLIHYPVLDRNGRIVTSAITSLDLHDIARSSHTYGVRTFFVIHPIAEQRKFAARVLAHWQTGYGRLYDSRRREALDLIQIVADLDAAIAAAASAAAARPLLVYTSARAYAATVTFASLRERAAASAPPLMILLGTGFGMAPAMLGSADLVAEPIRGPGEYNHLSVRAAASIILDRIRGG